MTKKCYLGLLTLISLNAIAATPNPIQQVNNQATINVGYLPTQIKSSVVIDNSRYLKGHQLSLGFDITKTFRDRIYTQFELETMGGNFSYGNHTPRGAATTDLEQVGLRLGYSFLPTPVIGLTPYMTAGYRYWQLDTGGIDFHGVSKNGSTKFYQNGFYGLGLLTQFTFVPKLVLSIDTALCKSFNPWMRYNAPDVHNTVIGNNVIYQRAYLLPEPFYQAGAGVDYALTPQIHANAGIQYNHSQYSSAIATPSDIKQPHLSLSAWNYHAGLGFSLEPEDKDSGAVHYFDNSSDTIIRANNLASLWFGYVTQVYAETLPNLGHYFDRQVGSIPFLYMGLSKTFQKIYTQFNFSLAGGSTAYKGESFTTSAYIGATASNARTRNTFFDTSLRIGYMFFPNDKLGLTPYVAGGFHRWLRDLPGIGGQNGYLTGGYPETYQHAWYALGLLTQFVPYQNVVLNFDANFGTTENGENRSWNSFDSPPTYQQTFSLKQRFTYNLGVGGDYRFARNWHALAQINYWCFKYGLSASSALGIYEPNSTTHFNILYGRCWLCAGLSPHKLRSIQYHRLRCYLGLFYIFFQCFFKQCK